MWRRGGSARKVTDGNGWGDDEDDFLAREMTAEWG